MAAATSLMLWMVIVIHCSLQPTGCAALEFHGVTSEFWTSEDRFIQVKTYWGIRYAEAPTGDQRFKLPKLYTHTETVVVANKTPPACIQETRPGSYVSTVGTSEDCLFLNIWEPSCYHKNYGKSEVLYIHPVIVWIHGGGLQKDTSSNPLYDGANLAAEICQVIVAVNYRLGVFGFMYLGHPDVPGNMGLQDVKTALEWLHINLHHFNGDANQITLAGNWAGAYIASTFLLANSTWELYNKAILQVNVNRLQNAYVRLTRETKTSMVSVTDDHFLVKDPIQYLMDGDIKNCNILIGDNADEGAYILKTAMPQLFNSLLHEPATKSEKVLNALLNVVITKYFKSGLLQSILPALKYIYHHMYVPAKPPRRLQIMSAISHELLTGCPLLLLANTNAKKGGNVFMYSFNYTSNSNESPGWFGATYRSEIPYVFMSSDKQNEPAKFTDQELQLSKNIQTMWQTFCQSPYPFVTEDIPIYNRTSPELIEFTRDADINIRSVDTSFCNYWNSKSSRAWNQELFQRAVSKYSDVFVERTYLP